MQGVRRWAGLLPLFFFLFTAVVYTRENRLGELLWICNVCNALLGLSILLSSSAGAWVATLWILIGTPLWVFDALKSHAFEVHSLLTHLGGGAVGLLVCLRQRPARRVWWVGFLLLAGLQMFAHELTRPELNVNVSFRAYGSAEPYFQYWLRTALSMLAALCIVEELLRRLSRARAGGG